MKVMPSQTAGLARFPVAEAASKKKLKNILDGRPRWGIFADIRSMEEGALSQSLDLGNLGSRIEDTPVSAERFQTLQVE